MLTPDQIDALREGVRKITDPITEYLLRDISRRIAQAGELTSTAAYQIWRAQQLGISQRQIKKELRRLLKLSHKEIRRIMYQSARSSRLSPARPAIQRPSDRLHEICRTRGCG